MNTTYVQKSSTVQKIADSKAASLFDSSSQSESLQRKVDMANNAAQRAEAPRPNNTGMPDNLKSGIESLSGFSMDDVRVHYNSSKPATVQALAYTQGTDIHVAPGQEKHLPHEAWHVAQQMAGHVSPTTNINGMPVNDNAGLEHEADVMGEKAAQCKSCRTSFSSLKYEQKNSVVQMSASRDEEDKMNRALSRREPVIVPATPLFFIYVQEITPRNKLVFTRYGDLYAYIKAQRPSIQIYIGDSKEPIFAGDMQRKLPDPTDNKLMRDCPLNSTYQSLDAIYAAVTKSAETGPSCEKKSGDHYFNDIPSFCIDLISFSNYVDIIDGTGVKTQAKMSVFFSNLHKIFLKSNPTFRFLNDIRDRYKGKNKEGNIDDKNSQSFSEAKQQVEYWMNRFLKEAICQVICYLGGDEIDIYSILDNIFCEMQRFFHSKEIETMLQASIDRDCDGLYEDASSKIEDWTCGWYRFFGEFLQYFFSSLKILCKETERDASTPKK